MIDRETAQLGHVSDHVLRYRKILPIGQFIRFHVLPPVHRGRVRVRRASDDVTNLVRP